MGGGGGPGRFLTGGGGGYKTKLVFIGEGSSQKVFLFNGGTLTNSIFSQG